MNKTSYANELSLLESVLDAEIQAAAKQGDKDKQIRLFLKLIEVWRELVRLAECGCIHASAGSEVFLYREN